MCTIEDVDFMLENSVQDSLTIFVDSGDRDKSLYESPSSYTVFFDRPVRNVFGIEILDATIPVTAYNVDETNNVLALSSVYQTPGVNFADFKASFVILQNCNTFFNNFSSNEMYSFFICTDKTKYDSMYVMTVDEFASTNTNTNTSGVTRTQYQDISVLFDISNMIICYYSTNIAEYITNSAIHHYSICYNDTIYYIEDIDIYNKYINLSNTSNYSFYIINKTLYIYEWKYCTHNQSLINIQNITQTQYQFIVCNSIITVSPGNYSSQDLLATLNNSFRNDLNPLIYLIDNTTGFYNIAFTDDVDDYTASKTQSIKIVYTYITNSSFCTFILDMKKSTINNVLGFSLFTNNQININNSNYVTIHCKTNKQLFFPIYINTTDANLHVLQVTSPGIINLESARYMIIRCPEIESHILGSYVNFKHSAGFALVKLTATNTMQQLRYDFVNIIRKPFHPIGKLSKLTFRFENKDTSLYDFKGVDHNLIITIKYYSPKTILRIPISTLNPNYNPNVLDYIIRKNKDKGSDGSDIDIDEVILEQQKYIN